jgi:hypothetical protein
MEGAGAQEGDEVSWGEARANQAVRGIAELIQTKYRTRQLQPEYIFKKVVVPPPTELVPMPTDVLDRFDKFERNRWYRGWVKSILPVASFDAGSTEFVLAAILEDNQAIKWWLRLRTKDPVYIELANGRKYYPDFIAIDEYGTHWLIEGKSNHEAQREDVKVRRPRRRSGPVTSTMTAVSESGDTCSRLKKSSSRPRAVGGRSWRRQNPINALRGPTHSSSASAASGRVGWIECHNRHGSGWSLSRPRASKQALVFPVEDPRPAP